MMNKAKKKQELDPEFIELIKKLEGQFQEYYAAYEKMKKKLKSN